MVQWDKREHKQKGGGNQTSFKKNSYLTKFIFWESGYLINILKGIFFLKIILIISNYVTYVYKAVLGKEIWGSKQSMSLCIWHFLVIIYNQLLEYVQKAHRPSNRIHLGNKPTLANKIQAGPAHTLFAHQLRTHRSNTHSFLQQLLVFIFGLES